MDDDYEFYWETPTKEKKKPKQPVKRMKIEENMKPFEIDLNFPKLNMPRIKVSVQMIEPVHLNDNGNALIAQIRLRGFKKEDIKFHVSESRLDIHTQQRHEQKSHTEAGFSHRQSSNSINRSIQLPAKIDPKKVVAKFENEILTIIMPKENRSTIDKLKEKLRKKKN
ncbi:MAG: Hsp20/alpha crystallin family protein [Candidatus Aenigmatarchaeota archaeon]